MRGTGARAAHYRLQASQASENASGGLGCCAVRNRYNSPMQDGLYQVTTPYLCAGFVLEHGRLVWCAPCLRRRFPYWQRIAVRIGA